MARCARCGEVFDEDDRRRALALGIDKPVHPRCWAPEWNDIAETYVATFATEDRGSFRIEDVVPFDDPNDAESHKWPTRLQHGWTFDDRRWWEGIAHDLAGWLAIECRHAVADPPRYHDTHPWWHCRHCLEQELLRWWDQVKNKTTWTLPEMDAMDLAFPIFGRLFRSPERPGREEWFEFARKWTRSGDRPAPG